MPTEYDRFIPPGFISSEGLPIYETDLTPQARLLYILILEAQGPFGDASYRYCTASDKFLGKCLGFSRKKIKYFLKELEKTGWLKIEQIDGERVLSTLGDPNMGTGNWHNKHPHTLEVKYYATKISGEV